MRSQFFRIDLNILFKNKNLLFLITKKYYIMKMNEKKILGEVYKKRFFEFN